MLCKVANLVDVADYRESASSSSDLCNLPITIVEKFGSRESAAILQLTLLAEDGIAVSSDKDILYVKWSGEVSSRYPECIEICEKSVRHKNVVRIGRWQLMEAVKEAVEVHVTPNGYFDWEILNSQADIVERNLLNQVMSMLMSYITHRKSCEYFSNCLYIE
jgi:Peroxisome biogenesis factor 1, N-terminal